MTDWELVFVVLFYGLNAIKCHDGDAQMSNVTKAVKRATASGRMDSSQAATCIML